MISISKKKRDSVFIAQTLRNNRLNPVPTPGYHEAPDYRRINGEWEMVIERYAWGVVLYLSKPGDDATVLAAGSVDVDNGTVDGVPLPIEWYSELIRRIGMEKCVDIPECGGYWVPCVTCDGGTNSAGEIEDACTWRRRCKLVQDHMLRINSDPKTYINRYGSDALQRLLERLEKASASTRKMQPKPKPKPKRTPKKRGRRPSPATQKAKRYAKVKTMFGEFMETVQAESLLTTGRWRITYCEKRTGAVYPGCLFIKDRFLEDSAYTLYMRRKKGKPFKVACIRLAPINRGLDVQIPDTSAPKGMPGDLRWLTWKDVPLWSVIRTIKQEHYEWFAKHLIALAQEALRSDNA